MENIKNINRIFVGDEKGNLEVKPVIKNNEKKSSKNPEPKTGTPSGKRIFYGDEAGKIKVENPKDRIQEVADDFIEQINKRVKDARRRK